MKAMKWFAVCLICLVANLTFGAQVLDTALARASGLHKLVNPTREEARDFFNWSVEKTPLISQRTGLPAIAQAATETTPAEYWNEYWNSRNGSLLHVGTSYNPIQPLLAFDTLTAALEAEGIDWKSTGVGEFDGGKRIFSQFDIGERGNFTAGGKEYKGTLTLIKGNDETVICLIGLVITCIVCANTFRMAMGELKQALAKGKEASRKRMAVGFKQTKNALVKLEKAIAMLRFQLRQLESVQATLNRMAKTPITLNEFDKATLGLLYGKVDKSELSKTGVTRRDHAIEIARKALANSPGVNGELTRESWLAVQTYRFTHGDDTLKGYNPGKVALSSEFGPYAMKKEKALLIASDDKEWAKAVQFGEVMQGLLARPLVISAVPTETAAQAGDDFARLMKK